MKAFQVVLTAVLIGLLVGVGSIVAQQAMINYQGKLAHDTGWPVTDNVSIVFCIYDQATGGIALWTETHNSVGVRSGIYNVLLGSVNPIPDDMFDGGDRWLGIRVNDDSEMSPRQRIASVGYAINSDMVDGKHASDFLDASSDWGRPGVATDLYEGTKTLNQKYVSTSGKSWINCNKCGVVLDIFNRDTDGAGINVYTWGDGYGVRGHSKLGDGIQGITHVSNHSGVYGWAIENGYGGYFISENGIGLHASGDSLAAFFNGGVNIFSKDLTVYQGDIIVERGAVNVRDDVTIRDGDVIVENGALDVRNNVTLRWGKLIVEHGSVDVKNNVTVRDGDVTLGKGDVIVEDGTVNAKIVSSDLAFIFPDGTFQATAGVTSDDLDHLNARDGDPTYALWVDNDGRVGVPARYSIDGKAVRLSVKEDVSDHFPMYVRHTNDTKGHGLRVGSNGGNWDDKLLNVIRDANGDNESIMCVKGDGTTFLGWTDWTDDNGNYTNKPSDLGRTCLAVNGHIHCKTLTNEYEASFENLVIQGIVFAAGKAFKIDHPSDPANKYLIHSCVESPDMMNVYNGNVVLDNSGYAWVELPGYFETLNRDFRYQLTPVGAPGPNLHIAEEISQNRFKIGGGEPGMKVSWQVTGVRKDRFAVKYKQPVELDKPADQRGKYLRPELYGLPETMKIDVSKRFQGTKPTIAKSAVAKPEVKEMEE